MKKLIISSILAVSMLCVTGWYWRPQETRQTQFQTAKITRGHLIAAFNATGTLEPEEVVAVSSLVAGRIESIGSDPSDKTKVLHWGSAVKKGTVLAQIEKTPFLAQVQTAQADLSKHTAELAQKKALLAKAEGDWKRAQILFPKAMSEAEFDLDKSVYEAAKASVEISKAQIDTAKVALTTAKTNLDNTTIVSPVDGVIIDTNIRNGQMVAPAATAPNLFLIATDLCKMEIAAAIKESDAGKIEVGQTVHITVDALPGSAYTGTVKAHGKFPSRPGSSVNQQAGTYTVLVSVDNIDGKLMPYLTAKLSFVVKEQYEAQLVSNAALAWLPSESLLQPTASDAYAAMNAKMKTSGAVAGQDLRIVWVKDGGLVRPILVRVGLSDGINTEILGVIDGELLEGTPVITGSTGCTDKM